MIIKLPTSVEFIIKRMKQHGKRADIVGGCVRDYMLGYTPDDYDLTTDATPEETKRIFSDFRIIETGLAHGTVTLMIDGKPYEITTYRIEKGYSDSRHPDAVEFTQTLALDLSRRDFTVNAMCYNPDYGITDIFGGKEDIESCTIRAVGDPDRRFSEDALRILRALRFSSKLGFEIEENTSVAAIKNAELLNDVSSERIFVELKKLIMGKNATNILIKYKPIISVILPELSVACDKLRDYPELLFGADFVVAFTSLFAIGSYDCASDFEKAVTRLKTDNQFKKTGITILSEYKSVDVNDDYSLVKLLSKCGLSTALDILALRLRLKLDAEDKRERLKELEFSVPYRISDLKINGTHLGKIGFVGREIGDALTEMLDAVMHGKIENSEQSLVSYAEAMRHKL